MKQFKTLRYLIGCVSLIVILGFLAANVGKFLVVDNPQHSTVIVVVAGDFKDARSQHALELFREGYAQELVLDAPDWLEYGRTNSDLAREYLQASIPEKKAHLHVCSFQGDSTVQELKEVAGCVQRSAPGAKTALLVTSNFHTRRALSVAQHVMPQYQWSAGAAPDERFQTNWWHGRESAKVMLSEWQKLVWWELVERWLKGL